MRKENQNPNVSLYIESLRNHGQSINAHISLAIREGVMQNIKKICLAEVSSFDIPKSHKFF